VWLTWQLYVFYKKEHFALATMGDEDMQRDLVLEDDAHGIDDDGYLLTPQLRILSITLKPRVE